MATNVTSQEYYEAPEGALVGPTDWTANFANIDNAVGWALALFGINDALPPINPVTVVPSGGLGLTIAGTNQFMACQGIIQDVCAADAVTLTTANATFPRIDLIAVKASRVAGTQTVTRAVRSDTATLPIIFMSGTLVAGTQTIGLPVTYPTAPVVNGLVAVGAGAGVLSATTSTTTITITSSNGSDVRAWNAQVYGAPTGSVGVSTVITLFENHPVWEVVTGTPGSSPTAPATPSGYEAFALVNVAANQTTLTSANITILFPTMPNLSGANTVNASNGSVALPGGVIMKWGSLTAVAEDSSTTDYTVTFNAPFPTGVYQVIPAIDVGSGWSGAQLSIQEDSLTVSGFKVTISGGAAGNTATVRYSAYGH
jgi:hypothetical protein